MKAIGSFRISTFLTAAGLDDSSDNESISRSVEINGQIK